MNSKLGFQIIEFNGLPGGGKSTIISELINEFYLNEFVVLSEADIFVEVNVFIKAFEFIRAILNIKFSKLNYVLFRIGLKASIINKSFQNIKNAMKIIRYNFVLNKLKEKRNFDIILLSEGYIQFICCIYDGIEFFKSSHLELLLSEINKLHKNLVIVNCHISKEEALERLKARKSSPNNIDLMNEKDKIEFMKYRSDNINIIREIAREKSSVLDIHTIVPVRKNVELLFSKLNV